MRDDTLQVSVMHSNLETGGAQSLPEIPAVAADWCKLLHDDAAQAALGRQFVTVALADKLSALQTEGLIEARASRADLDRYSAILAKVPNVPTASGDELPQG